MTHFRIIYHNILRSTNFQFILEFQILTQMYASCVFLSIRKDMIISYNSSKNMNDMVYMTNFVFIFILSTIFFNPLKHRIYYKKFEILM
jgi:hypothetical protein